MIYRFEQNDGIYPNAHVDLRPDAASENPSYQADDMEAADIKTVRRVTRELIRTNGARVYVHSRTDNADVDAVYNEDPDPTYCPPVLLRAFSVPKPFELSQTKHGPDAPLKTKITFHLDDIAEAFPNRLIRPGDLIQVQYNSRTFNRPVYFYVNNAGETGNFRYVWLYVTCDVVSIFGDVNVRPATDQLQYIEFNEPGR